MGRSVRLLVQPATSTKTALPDQNPQHHRLPGMEQGKVKLRYKDYRDHQSKILKLNPKELIRRFLLHVLPKGLMRIRHYGFLANACRKKQLKMIRKALGKSEETDKPKEQAPSTQPFKTDHYPCPKCKTGQLQVIGELSTTRRLH